jgi:hypothetical protein
MRRLYTGVLIAGATLAVTLGTGGSAYAGVTQAPTITPMTQQEIADMQSDMGMCRSHMANRDTSTTSTGM